ncbi:hypothetical protein OH77DRAFT_1586427 [Trametes cingulata]|nr:hypothetical protein OH77DRAFT_1586427 [Trametes cingulata]
MAPKKDLRVKEIVDTLLVAEGVQWASYLHLCPMGAHHMVEPSYGGDVWENVGSLYEVCAAELDLRCQHHGEPLARQLANESRLAMLKRLHNLRPAPYNKPLYWGQSLYMFGMLERKIEAEGVRSAAPSTPAKALRAPAPRSASGSTQRSSSRATSLSTDDGTDASGSFGGFVSTGSESAPRSSGNRGWGPMGRSRVSGASGSSNRSDRGPVGRPVNPTCKVIVYVYIPGEEKPMVINAAGTPRGNVVEFVFGQSNIKDALRDLPGAGAKRTYLYYNRTIGDWTLYPKPHQPLFLAPDERALYREENVSKLPNLNYYVAQLLAATRSIAATPSVPLPSTHARLLPSAPAYAHSPSASSSLAHSTPRILSSPEQAQLLDRVPPSDADRKGKKRMHSMSPLRPQLRRKTTPRPDSPNAIDLTSDEGEGNAGTVGQGHARASTSQHQAQRLQGKGRQSGGVRHVKSACEVLTGKGTADDMYVIE